MAHYNPVGWFEIPVKDMERAMGFYKAVLGVPLERHMMGELDMAWFPMDERSMGAAGSLVKHRQYRPSKVGVLLYFTAPSGDIQEQLRRVEGAGGNIEQPRTKISDDVGYMAIIHDTEGNRIALHSRA